MTEPEQRWRTVHVAEFAIDVLEAVDVDKFLERAIESGGPSPYGVVLWPSALAIANRLVALGDLTGTRVVDVGTGLGLCALVAAKLGAQVTALDLDPAPLSFLASAAQKNRVQIRTEQFNLLDEADPLPAGELFVFADLLYEVPLAEGTATRVMEAAGRGARCLVGDPERAFRERFCRRLRAAGWPCRFETEHVQVAPAEPVQRIGVLDLVPTAVSS